LEDTKEQEFLKHEAISELLDIPLKCPHCGEFLKTFKTNKETDEDN
jgi:hypothetical protein|tara:strand:+ start:104 stop:241 length:138 start_codon:yes stop_codon:yes gene_type:complete